MSDPMPRARLVSDVRTSAHVADDVARIDIARVALVERAVAPVSGVPGQARVVSDRPGRTTVETNAAGAQLLVLTERFDEGWQATDGDHPCAVVRVYGDRLGCVVANGAHTIAFVFAPDSFRDGLRLTLAGLMLNAFGVIWLRRPVTAD